MVSKLESGEYNYTIEQLWKISKKLGWKLNISFDGICEDNYSVGYNAENQTENNNNGDGSFYYKNGSFVSKQVSRPKLGTSRRNFIT
jgi:hypothetical protein